MFEYALKLLQKFVDETHYPVQMSFLTNSRIAYSIDILHLEQHDIKICFYNNPNNSVEIHLVEKKNNKSLYLYLYKSTKDKDLPDVDTLFNRIVTFVINYDSFEGEKTNDILMYMWDKGELPPPKKRLINKEGVYRLYFKDCTDTLAIVSINKDGEYYFAPISTDIKFYHLKWTNDWANVIDYEEIGVQNCQ